VAAEEISMQEPLQIAFHNMASSPQLEQRVRELFAKLERYYDGIISARIVIEAPHKQPHKSTIGISISIGVPGRDIVVKREQRLHEADDHNVWVLNEAFDAAARQVEEYSRIRRREVKAPEPERQYARIVRLHSEQDYGFIETRERQNLYFHRAVVRDDQFDALEIGSEVYYTLADDEGAMGPMASNIELIRADR
jgi:cold shock CspA family protein/ribosome-associated translation inhibitor RaiA